MSYHNGNAWGPYTPFAPPITYPYPMPYPSNPPQPVMPMPTSVREITETIRMMKELKRELKEEDKGDAGGAQGKKKEPLSYLQAVALTFIASQVTMLIYIYIGVSIVRASGN